MCSASLAFLWVFALLCLLAANAIGQAPTRQLTNGVLTATVYLPDSENGYYRGPRFDWSGMIASVERDGHRFFGEWRMRPKPKATDNVVGTAGEFGIRSPLGYDEAKAGECFVKIGVGRLRRPDNEPYHFSRQYEVLPSPWVIREGKHWIEFQQELSAERGWGYRFTKRIELAPAAPDITIRYILENTGSQRITTDHYCHNFVVFDDRESFPGGQVRLDFAPTDQTPVNEIAVLDNQTIRLTAPLPFTQSLHREFLDLPEGAGQKTILENTATGTSLWIERDTPTAHAVFCRARRGSGPG